MINAILLFLLSGGLFYFAKKDAKTYNIPPITLFGSIVAGACFMCGLWSLCDYLGV